MNTSDLHLILALTRVPGIGDVLAKRILNSFESIDQLQNLSKKSFQSKTGIMNLDPQLFFQK